MIPFILATFLALRIAFGAGPADTCACDSLEAQRAVAQGAWGPCATWAGPSPALRYTGPLRVVAGDTTVAYVSQSTATATRNTYRVRCWHNGRVAPWSRALGVVTSAPDTVYALMSQDGRLVPGTWVAGAGKVAISEPAAWPYDSTVRIVSQREIQNFWAQRINELFGYVR